MGNNTKKFVIEIEMGAAQQALAETSKKLSELDQKLEGLDRNSDAAKAIVAEMGKMAKQSEAAEAEIGRLNGRLDGLKPGSVGAIRQEVKELTAELNNTVEGTQEYERALLKLGGAKAELKNLRSDLLALNPEKQIIAFSNFASGVVGGFGIMATAAENFGLSSASADEFTKKTQGVIAVLQSLEGIRAALDGENIRAIKSTLSLGKAYIAAGEGASAGSKVTKAALISTGIGALVVLVGILIANWDNLTASVKGSEAFFTKIKAITSGLFDSAVASVKVCAALLKDFFTGNLPALIEDAKGAGKKVGDAYAKGYAESIAESNRKVLQGQIDAQARLIDVMKARGVETYALEEANLEAKLRLQKRGTDEEKKQYLDLQKDLDVLRAGHAKKESEDALAETAARLGGVLSLEQAKGRDSYAAQLALEKQKLEALKAAADPQLAAIEAQENAITALIATKDKERADKRRARQAATLQAELVIRTAQGGDEYQLALDQNALQEKIAAQHLQTLRSAGQVDRAAVVAAEADVFRLRIERADIFYKERQKQEAASAASIANEIEGPYVRGLIREKKYQADLLIVNKGAAKVAEQLAAEAAERVRIAAIPKTSVTDTVLIRIFGVSDKNLEKVKAGIQQAAEAVNAAVSQYYAGAQAEADARVTEAQDRLSAASSALADNQKKQQDDEKALQGATGARRDYLLKKIAAERLEEEKLNAAKNKAAADEKKRLKEQAQLQKESQRVSLALTAATAIQAAVEAIASAAKLPFPANIPSIIVAGATVASGIFAAKALGNAFADGGFVTGPGGPRADQVPAVLSSGEFVMNADATAKNRNLLESMNANNNRVLPPGTLALGAGASGGSAADGNGTSAADIAQLVTSHQELIALTRQLVTHAATTAEKPPLIIGPYEATQIEKQRQSVLSAEASAAL